VVIKQVIHRALSLMQEQLRLRQIEVQLHFPADEGVRFLIQLPLTASLKR